jgi:hypothetical protein
MQVDPFGSSPKCFYYNRPAALQLQNNTASPNGHSYKRAFRVTIQSDVEGSIDDVITDAS